MTTESFAAKVVALSALASIASALKVCDTAQLPVPAEYPDGDCGMAPWQTVFGTQVTQYARHIVTTDDGYDLSMVRLINTLTDGSVLGPAATAGSKGPVLLQHGVGADGLAWVQGIADLTQTPPFTLPETLFDAGYDVWIANTRGTLFSATHTSLDPNGTDPATGAAAYWDFGVEEMAKQDITAEINEIMTIRQDEGNCEKVKLLTHSKGASFSLIVADAFPTTTAARVELLLNNTPCFFPNIANVVNPLLDTSDDSSSTSTDFDHSAYYAAFSDLKAELDSDTYRAFYYAFDHWLRKNYYDWWKKWEQGIQESVCKVDPSNSRCIPANLQDSLNFAAAADSLGIVRLYSPTWAADYAAICNIAGAENYICLTLSQKEDQFNGNPFGDPQLSLDAFDTFGQQAYLQKWAKFNPDFATNGWFTEPELYGSTNVNVPVYNWYVAGDTTCPEIPNIPVGDMIPTQDSRMLWTNGRDHPNFIGQTSETYYVPLILTLGSTPVALDGTCGTIDFSTPWE